MRLAILTAVLAAGLATTSPALADQSDAQAWGNFTGQYRLSGKLLLWAEAQARFSDDTGGLAQSIIRPALGWQAAPRFSLWAGYGRITNHRPGRDQGEDRLWQQALWNVGPALGGQVTSRSRLEQRRVDGGGDTGWRVRQFLKYERPLRTGGDASLVLWNETFVALNNADWGARAGFDQNRAFAGVGFSVAPKVRAEIGYMNQYIDRAGADDRVNHIASLTFLKRL